MNLIPLEDMKKKLERNKPLNIKLGVDPTSPDLHIGHAVPLRKLRQFQDLGHNVTLIIGDGTALIGDPSGRNTTRPQLSREKIQENAQTYVDQAFKILDPEKTVLRYNSEWILDLNMESLLKLLANFTVARILERDDFHNRYTSGQSISLHEFLYPVMQTPWSSRPMWSSGAPTSCSTCSPVASSWRRWAWSPRSASRCPCSRAPMA